VYEPKRPTLVAAAACGLWIAVLSLPMLTGQWLGSPVGDFNPAGFASRTWGAEWWHRLGHVPLWEPLLFGGMPYIGAGHGDLFYPTSFLRLVFPIAAVFDSPASSPTPWFAVSACRGAGRCWRDSPTS
jgi:hypothetical protein